MIAQTPFRHPTLSPRVRKFLVRIFAGLFVVALFLGGVQLRRWIGDTTRHVRYQHDIVNGFYWGERDAERSAPVVTG